MNSTLTSEINLTLIKRIARSITGVKGYAVRSWPLAERRVLCGRVAWLIVQSRHFDSGKNVTISLSPQKFEDKHHKHTHTKIPKYTLTSPYLAVHGAAQQCYNTCLCISLKSTLFTIQRGQISSLILNNLSIGVQRPKVTFSSLITAGVGEK